MTRVLRTDSEILHGSRAAGKALMVNVFDVAGG